jgi:hypothetical protein
MFKKGIGAVRAYRCFNTKMQFVSAPVFAQFTVKIRFCDYWLGYILFFKWAAYNKYLAKQWTIFIINNMAAFLSFTNQMFAMSQQAVSAALKKNQFSLWKKCPQGKVLWI